MLEAPTEYNARIVSELRANKGHAGGEWEGIPLLLLHHTGGQSGVRRVNPVAYLPEGEGYLVWAANGGAPRSPDWYHNLKANPRTTIEVDGETIDVEAQEATGAERAPLCEGDGPLPAAPRGVAEDRACDPVHRPHPSSEHLSVRARRYPLAIEKSQMRREQT